MLNMSSVKGRPGEEGGLATVTSASRTAGGAFLLKFFFTTTYFCSKSTLLVKSLYSSSCLVKLTNTLM